MRCDYYKDHGHETNRCRSLKFLVERLIKAGHLRRYIRGVDREEESAPIAGRITTGVAAPPESRSVINYILRGRLTISINQNANKRSFREQPRSKPGVLVDPGNTADLLQLPDFQPDEAFPINVEFDQTNPLWLQQRNNHDIGRYHTSRTSKVSHPTIGFILSCRRPGTI